MQHDLEQKVLMEAKNGMQVWVPIDKLEDWKRAQDDTSEETARAKALLKQRLMEQLSRKHTASGSEPATSLPTVKRKPLPAFAPIQRSGISESVFFRKYESEKRAHPFRSEYVGLLNPYLKEPVQSEADYYLYLREHTYQLLCDKLVEEQTEAICEQAKKEMLLADADREAALKYVDKRDKELRRMRVLFFVILGLTLAVSITLVCLSWFH